MARHSSRLAGGRSSCSCRGDDLVQSLALHHFRNLVKIVDVAGRDDCFFRHVREQRDLAPLFCRQWFFGPTDQNVRLNSDRAQFLDRVLRGFGLDLRRGCDIRHQRQMNVDNTVPAEFDAHLANRLEERQRLDVADRAADFDQADVGIPGTKSHALLDFVGNVRNYLHRRTEVVAATFLCDHALVDSTGGEVAVAPGGRAHESFVVTEVEVRFRAVLGDEYFTVLKRAHGAGIDVDVRIQLNHADRQPTGFEYRAKARRGDSLAKGRDNTTGYEDERSHVVCQFVAENNKGPEKENAHAAILAHCRFLSDP